MCQNETEACGDHLVDGALAHSLATLPDDIIQDETEACGGWCTCTQRRAPAVRACVFYLSRVFSGCVHTGRVVVERIVLIENCNRF